VLADAIGVVVIAAVQVASVRRPVPAIKVLGAQQMLLGLVLVVVTAVGVLVS